MFHPEDRCFYLYIIIMLFIFFLGFLILGVQFICYYKAPNIYNFEENDPDIIISLIKDIQFRENYNIKYYNPKNSNLGTTGKVYYRCYFGNCTKTIKRICEKEFCYSGSNDEYPSSNNFDFKKNFLLRKLSSCHMGEYDCSYTEGHYEHDCSEECSTIYDKSRTQSYCKSCPINYDKSSGECIKRNNLSNFINGGYCQTDNLIYFWKGLYYERTFLDKNYTYIKNVFTPNEECPLGLKVCGILDKLGNKLCIPKNEICPINFIALSNEPPDPIHVFDAKKIGNNTLYLSNDFVDQKIFGGLFVDSDLSDQYNNSECKLLDNYTINDLIKENGRIYLNLTIRNGTSYLRWCPTNFNSSNISLEKLREINKIYLHNKTVNNDIINKSKSILTFEFFSTFLGGIYLLIFCITFIWGSCYEISNDKTIFCVKNCNSDNEIIDFLKFFAVLSPFIIISIICVIFSSIIKNDLNKANLYPTQESDLFNSLLLLNIIYFWGIIGIYGLILLLFLLSCLIFSLKFCYNSNDINFQKLKNVNLL